MDIQNAAALPEYDNKFSVFFYMMNRCNKMSIVMQRETELNWYLKTI